MLESDEEEREIGVDIMADAYESFGAGGVAEDTLPIYENDKYIATQAVDQLNDLLNHVNNSKNRRARRNSRVFLTFSYHPEKQILHLMETESSKVIMKVDEPTANKIYNAGVVMLAKIAGKGAAYWIQKGKIML